jgi:parvulin-like peptidyl-prolyl isomerase
MRSLFRRIGIQGLFLSAVLSLSAGCVRQQPSADAVPPPPAVSKQEARTTVVARVNGVELYQDAFIEVMGRVNAANERRSTPDPQDVTRRKALDLLVLEELAVQEAKRQGVSLGPSGLDNAMAKLQAKLGHEEGLKNYLAKENLSEAELRIRVERSLLIRLMYDREVVQKASVVPVEEVRKEYEQHKAQYRAPEKITLVDVVLFLKQDDSDSQKKAAEVLSRIQAEKEQDPRNLAADGTFAVRTLDSQKDEEPLLYDAARKLKPGEVSGVISTPDSLHIVKLLEYAPERPLTYEEVSGAVERRLRAVAQQKRRLEWEQELKKDAKIELPDASGRLEPGKP